MYAIIEYRGWEFAVNGNQDYPRQPRVRAIDPASLAEPYAWGAGFDVFDKLDGWRLLLRSGAALLRNGRNVWDQLPAAIQARCGAHWLDGELLVPAEPATAVATALAQRDQRLTFRPFHIAGFAGDARAEHAELIRMGWEPPEYLGRHTAGQIASQWPGWASAVSEGVVLRPVDGGAWLKIKRLQSVDLAVVALRPGRGRLAGLVGALVCKLPGGGTVNVGTGLADDERRLDGRAIGRVAEIAYQCETARGSLRHPCFLRWRDDVAA